jgi:glucan phosphoethanolaminetransferase (alkaline phosphatase superfamily)
MNKRIHNRYDSVKKGKIWLSRTLIGLVFFMNMLCAIQFMAQPAAYSYQFDLSGEQGIVVIRSIGILFTMWNVPYAIAILDPVRFKVALVSALMMQLIGFIGETSIYLNVLNLLNTKQSILRFMYFDLAGFLILIMAYLLVSKRRKYE